MKKQVFVLLLRVFEVFITSLALLVQFGVFQGKFALPGLLYYTVQSNIAVLVIFILLLAFSIKHRRELSSPSLTRLSCLGAIWITVTMLVYWTMLVPFIEAKIAFSFQNVVLHTVTPILMLVEYIFLGIRGAVRKTDPFLGLLLPFCYFVFTIIAGFGNLATYSYMEGGEVTRFPYFFLDWDKSGARVPVYVLALFIAILGLGFLARRLNRKA